MFNPINILFELANQIANKFQFKRFLIKSKHISSIRRFVRSNIFRRKNQNTCISSFFLSRNQTKRLTELNFNKKKKTKESFFKRKHENREEN
jgi:hypothetical protein